ncbi:MAG: helix-turn-helix domain-containing protein [Nitrososphaerota archaeon]
MSLIFEDRLSDAPYVDRIWRSHSEVAGPFVSMALNRMQMVVWTDRGKTYFTVRGPETKATPAHCPVHAEFVGIVFKCGVFMPHLPLTSLLDSAVTLPGAASASFWLRGSVWQFPTYDNADTFVARLMRDGSLVYDPAVDDALQGRLTDLSLRSAQRRFVRATGLTQSAIRQIERARYATTLLRQGVPILDTVFQTGYFDQPHLTRSLRHFIGQTPAQLLGKSTAEQLSYLYKTSPFG